jgi:NAD(P)H-flavin reductase
MEGMFEFHVRAVPGGQVSGSIVADTAVGDQWQISSPRGDLTVDSDVPAVLMVAGGTGLAPLRAIILDLIERKNPPQVYLFFGGKTVQDLYASDMLWILTRELPWLTTIPVVEHISADPIPDKWYEAIIAKVGQVNFHEDDLLEGTLADVVSDHGPFTEHRILICGSPMMVAATRDRLVATGTPTEAIYCDQF